MQKPKGTGAMLRFTVLQDTAQGQAGGSWDVAQYKTIWPNSFSALEFQVNSAAHPLLTTVYNPATEVLA
eukprot:9252136-Prorocentrum_lima.AAC.1